MLSRVARRPVGILLVGLPLLAVAPGALAFRCGSQLVTEGDHASQVRAACGEPTGIQTRTIVRSGVTRQRLLRTTPPGVILQDEILIPDRSFVEVVVEEWTYNLGPRKLMRLVRFENGFVVEVVPLGYGFVE
jgi:hypothetical protein